MLHCSICKQEMRTTRSLSKHIRDKHTHLTIQDYYDLYLKKDKEDFCIICNTPTRFKGLGVGYCHTCSRVCGAIYHRQRLKNNEKQFKLFCEKVSYNQEKIWSKRSKNEVRNIIRKGILSTKNCEDVELLLEKCPPLNINFLTKILKLG